MGLDFKIKDFFHPLKILKFKRQFEKNQWLGVEQLTEYQSSRLQTIIHHAYENVPFYQKIFKERQILPDDIKNSEDLRLLPLLNRSHLRGSFKDLQAQNAGFFKPTLLSTSGTTGGAVNFYVDQPSNILEFVFYWRFWSWAGYRLGDTFAELSAQFFTPYEAHKDHFFHFEKLSRRVMVNSLLISKANGAKYVEVFRKFKPRFVKGLPSNLYLLALVLHAQKDHGVSFKAVFSQGENLLEYQRALIEKVFDCKVYDYYGHMERTVAITQCGHGKYHVHLDYGVAEFIPTDAVNTKLTGEGDYIAEVVGTSLHNMSMPLIRYRTGDFVRISRQTQQCPCGRGLPVVEGILGRDSDIVVTPDGRAITALYVVFDKTPGVIYGQIVQEMKNKLQVRIALDVNKDPAQVDAALLRHLRDFLGEGMAITIDHVSCDDVFSSLVDKFKSIISKVSPEEILREYG